MKILLAGDTHGSIVNVQTLFKKASDEGCKIILVLGDFGHFPHLSDGRAFLKAIRQLSRQYKIVLHWIKGNHDNHEALSSFTRETEIIQGCIYHPNMVPWTWGKYTFVAVGGAYSIDKNQRTPGVDWWPEEEISNADVYACDSIRADIIVSHDCPLSVDLSYYLNYKTDPNTHRNRQKLQAIVEVVKPKYLFHGHYHVRTSLKGETSKGKFDCIGLAANINSLKAQTFVLDCEADSFDFTIPTVNYATDPLIVKRRLDG